MINTNPMNCQELVERVTDFIEETLPETQRVRFGEHLSGCNGCQAYLAQMKHVIGMLERLPGEKVSREAKEELLKRFRVLHAPNKKTVEKNVRLGIKDQYASPGDHIAYFWESDQSFKEGVGFLSTGLEGSEHGFIFGHEQANQKVLSSLQERGLNVSHLIESGRLSLIGGNSSGDITLSSIAKQFKRAIAEGASLLRLLGNIGWGLKNWPGEDEIMEFEARVTEAARQFPCVIVCMYDVRSLSGRVILKGGFGTHPLTVWGSHLLANPHYVPTEDFLLQMKQEKA